MHYFGYTVQHSMVLYTEILCRTVKCTRNNSYSCTRTKPKLRSARFWTIRVVPIRQDSVNLHSRIRQPDSRRLACVTAGRHEVPQRFISQVDDGLTCQVLPFALHQVLPHLNHHYAKSFLSCVIIIHLFWSCNVSWGSPSILCFPGIELLVA